MKLRIILIIIVAFVVIGGIIFARTSAAGAAENQITTAKVSQKSFVKNIQSSGKTKAAISAELKFQTSGKLAWVGVKEGDTVTAYQAIASLDAREVQKNLTKTLRDYSSERSDFEQSWKDNWIAAAESHESLTHAPTNAIKRILEKNQWDLDKAVLDVELKHLALEYATLVTPIAGIVAHIDTPVAGVNITPASASFEVIDPTSLVFQANVDEVDVGSLVLGQMANITLDAFADATFSAKISYISYISETSAGGATVFPVKMTFDQPQRLRIGLNGDVSIEVYKNDTALVIPVEALREEDSSKFVYRKNKETYEKVPITIGRANDDVVEVTSGLSQGDVVVTKGFTNIPKDKK